ncbi:MaoC/PaaZ C-terminal domain-containing protein [Sodalis glossinidius]|uniref:MaoC/PaaZ C-terminal domain-containing protein n=1 Tax=Sodalis glossinidius TaxID=63612 RepID=UPI000308EF4B|nr:MaoC/PaaZ C-terminal domain-containing protein [Sodalis glossinidius]
MFIDKYFEEFVLGETRTTTGRTITESDIVLHAGMTAGDINSRAMTYGYEKLNFPEPVFIGDTLQVKVSISEKRTIRVDRATAW